VEKASAFRARFSKSLANRRQRLSQAKVRSTTQRRGRSSNPFARSERLTISICRCGRILAEAFERPGPDIRHQQRALQKWIQTEQSGENKHAAVTILNIGWMHNSMKQQA